MNNEEKILAMLESLVQEVENLHNRVNDLETDMSLLKTAYANRIDLKEAARRREEETRQHNDLEKRLEDVNRRLDEAFRDRQ